MSETEAVVIPEPDKPPTKLQREVLELIAASVRSRGFPPSVREIGAAMGQRESSTIHQHLLALERKGLITRTPRIPRGIRITPAGQAYVGPHESTAP